MVSLQVLSSRVNCNLQYCGQQHIVKEKRCHLELVDSVLNMLKNI